jgi:hypothetical protein
MMESAPCCFTPHYCELGLTRETPLFLHHFSPVCRRCLIDRILKCPSGHNPVHVLDLTDLSMVKSKVARSSKPVLPSQHDPAPHCTTTEQDMPDLGLTTRPATGPSPIITATRQCHTRKISVTNKATFRPPPPLLLCSFASQLFLVAVSRT